jgi:hypothetical protein
MRIQSKPAPDLAKPLVIFSFFAVYHDKETEAALDTPPIFP